MSSQQSIHRVSKAGRWFTVLAVPPLLALMGWGMFEVIHNYRSGDPDVNAWIASFAILMFGGLSLVFVAALIWAFRGRIVLDGERMTLRGAFTTTVVTAERMAGFRNVNGQLYIYLHDRRFALQIGFMERLWQIENWVRQHAVDVLGEMLDEEDEEIARDQDLGWTDTDKEQTLQRLRILVQRLTWLAYLATGVAIGNVVFLGNVVVDKVTVSTLMLIPVFLDLIALSHRGHVRIDHDEGSRYPQIFTATITCGGALTLLAIIERGAFVDQHRFYELLAFAVLAKGLLWCFIDSDRLKAMRKRGGFVLALTLFAFFALPAFWAGGTLYYANRYLDASDAEWYVTSVQSTQEHLGRITTYSVTIAPWNPDVLEAIEIDVRRNAYDLYKPGMPVCVAVRDGALGVRWVAGLRAVANTTGSECIAVHIL